MTTAMDINLWVCWKCVVHYEVELFYVEGQLSAREIADKLGVGKSAITMRLERFRARVKRELTLRVLAGKL